MKNILFVQVLFASLVYHKKYMNGHLQSNSMVHMFMMETFPWQII